MGRGAPDGEAGRRGAPTKKMWDERHGGIVWTSPDTASRGPEHPTSCYAFGPAVSTHAADPTTVVLSCRSRCSCGVLSVGVVLGHSKPSIVHDRINYQISTSNVSMHMPRKARLYLKTLQHRAEYRGEVVVKLHLRNRHLRIERDGTVFDVAGIVLPERVRPYAMIFESRDSCSITVLRPFLAEKLLLLAVVAARHKVPEDLCRRLASAI